MGNSKKPQGKKRAEKLGGVLKEKIKKFLDITICQKLIVFEHYQKHCVSEVLKDVVCLGFWMLRN